MKFLIKRSKSPHLNISAREFETGAYIYGIELDGKIVKSKKMLIIK